MNLSFINVENTGWTQDNRYSSSNVTQSENRLVFTENWLRIEFTVHSQAQFTQLNELENSLGVWCTLSGNKFYTNQTGTRLKWRMEISSND
jgi:hypothetical protein